MDRQQTNSVQKMLIVSRTLFPNVWAKDSNIARFGLCIKVTDKNPRSWEVCNVLGGETLKITYLFTCLLMDIQVVISIFVIINYTEINIFLHVSFCIFVF